MRAKLIHRNTHVYDLDATLAFFIADPDGCWIEIVRGLDEIPLEANRVK